MTQAPVSHPRPEVALDGWSETSDRVHPGGTSPLITPEHGYHVLEIMLKAKAAAQDGVTREIKSTFTPPQFDDEGRGIPPHLVHNPTREVRLS
jgi:hypothetical protein